MVVKGRMDMWPLRVSALVAFRWSEPNLSHPYGGAHFLFLLPCLRLTVAKFLCSLRYFDALWAFR